MSNERYQLTNILRRKVRQRQLCLHSLSFSNEYRDPTIGVGCGEDQSLAIRLVAEFGGWAVVDKSGDLRWFVEKEEAVRVGKAIKPYLYGPWKTHIEQWETGPWAQSASS